ncbi:MAG: cupin domain-containing protein [Chloroflexi bacterium]|nr:MAG: cupin domain-containing protein [Chloroflexota bacterium]
MVWWLCDLASAVRRCYNATAIVLLQLTPLFVQKGRIMDTNAQAGQAHMSGSSTAGSSFEPAFYKVDSINEVTLVEGIDARFVTGSRIMFSFVHLAPGAIMPDHHHPHEQLGYVLEGSMVLNMAGDERNLQPGDAYTIPGGITHRAVGGPNGCLVLDAFSPPREEYLERARQGAKAE